MCYLSVLKFALGPSAAFSPGLPSPAIQSSRLSAFTSPSLRRVTARIKKITNLPLRLIEAISKPPTKNGTRISSCIPTPQPHSTRPRRLPFTFFTTPVHALLYFAFSRPPQRRLLPGAAEPARQTSSLHSFHRRDDHRASPRRHSRERRPRHPERICLLPRRIVRSHF